VVPFSQCGLECEESKFRPEVELFRNLPSLNGAAARLAEEGDDDVAKNFHNALNYTHSTRTSVGLVKKF